MINVLSANGKVTYNVYEFICDTEDDIENLSKNCAAGSTAFVIETKDVYMLNSKREWVKI